jgi:hypothetical protein
VEQRSFLSLPPANNGTRESWLPVPYFEGHTDRPSDHKRDAGKFYTVFFTKKMFCGPQNTVHAGPCQKCDQTPVYFDTLSNITVEERGTKMVLIIDTSNKKTIITVLLSVFTNGHKLPPHVILHRKTMPKELLHARPDLSVPGKRLDDQ